MLTTLKSVLKRQSDCHASQQISNLQLRGFDAFACKAARQAGAKAPQKCGAGR